MSMYLCVILSQSRKLQSTNWKDLLRKIPTKKNDVNAMSALN